MHAFWKYSGASPNKLLLYLVAAVALSGGGAMAAPKPAFMALGEFAGAPLGFLDFCSRRPADCRAARPQRLATAPQAQFGVQEGAGPASVIRTSALGGGARMENAVFSYPNGASPAPAPAAVEARPDGPPHLDAALMAHLDQTNRRINGAIKPETDMQSHGVPDHWDLPFEEGENVGDCEDYALEKQKTLANEGFPAAQLSLAVVRTRWGEEHAVLIATTDGGDLVLDNLSPWVTPWNQTNYQWLERQVPGHPLEWVSVAGAAQAPPAG